MSRWREVIRRNDTSATACVQESNLALSLLGSLTSGHQGKCDFAEAITYRPMSDSDSDGFRFPLISDVDIDR